MNSIYINARFDGRDIQLVDKAFRNMINSFPENAEIELTEFGIRKYFEDEEAEDSEQI